MVSISIYDTPNASYSFKVKGSSKQERRGRTSLDKTVLYEQEGYGYEAVGTGCGKSNNIEDIRSLYDQLY